MTETIEAITETNSDVAPPTIDSPAMGLSMGLDARIRRRLQSEGATAEEVTRILGNLHLLWDSSTGLSEAEQSTLEHAKLDQQNFFPHQHT